MDGAHQNSIIPKMLNAKSVRTTEIGSSKGLPANMLGKANDCSSVKIQVVLPPKPNGKCYGTATTSAVLSTSSSLNLPM